MGLLSRLGKDTLGMMGSNAFVGGLGGAALAGGMENPTAGDFVTGAGLGAGLGAAIGGGRGVARAVGQHMGRKRDGQDLMFAALDAMKAGDDRTLAEIYREALEGGHEAIAKNIADYRRKIG